MKAPLRIVVALVCGVLFFTSCLRDEDMELLRHPIHVQGTIDPTLGIPIGYGEVTIHDVLKMINEDYSGYLDTLGDIVTISYRDSFDGKLQGSNGKKHAKARKMAPKGGVLWSKDTTITFSLPIDFHILIIDDGSPDGTANIVKQLMNNHFANRLFIIERQGKQGLGTAYITGFQWALQHQYDYIFEMDADFSHNPNDLLKLYDACHVHGADVAIGSRYVSGVNVVNWPIGRVLMSYFASIYVRTVLGMNIHDTTAGFKCYRRQVLQTIELEKIHFKGYAFQIEMKFTAYKCGFHIVEVPIVFVNRVLGTSKMSGGIFSEALLGVIRLKLQSIFRHYPQKSK